MLACEVGAREVRVGDSRPPVPRSPQSMDATTLTTLTLADRAASLRPTTTVVTDAAGRRVRAPPPPRAP